LLAALDPGSSTQSFQLADLSRDGDIREDQVLLA
jgi:hypothetical protein